MEVRKAELKDAEKIAKIFVHSYNIETIGEGITVFKEEHNIKSTYLIAEKENEILGFVSWAIKDLPKHQLAELCRIAVLPEYRGKGVAQKLFKKLLEEIHEFYNSQNLRLRKLFLLVHSSNKRANSFYKKIGFNHEATLKNHLYDGEDEHVYSMFF